MSLSDRRRRRKARNLSIAVSELPAETRRAMLAAIETEELIVGAYTDLNGRMCPMLAAHRRGARTHVGSFPRAWDAFARARRPRRANERELQILKALLQEGFGESAESHVEPTRSRQLATTGCEDLASVAARGERQRR